MCRAISERKRKSLPETSYKITGEVNRKAVAAHHESQRIHRIYRYEWKHEGKVLVKKRVLHRVVYKSPAQ